MLLKKKPTASKSAAPKANVRKAVVKQAQPLLQLFSQTNFSGTRRQFRGNLGVRNLEVLGINDDAESFRFSSPSVTATLVLFTDRNYQGRFVIFNGPQNVEDLADFNIENQASSLIMSNTALSRNDVQLIQDNRQAPNNFAEILQIIRKGRAARKAKAKK